MPAINKSVLFSIWNFLEIIKQTSHSALLKMLGLYLYTLIIGHKSCNMLSIQNKLILQKKLQYCVTNNVFGHKIKNTKHKFKHKNPCRSRELNPQPLALKVDALPLHYRVNWEYQLIEVKLFNCFDTMGDLRATHLKKIISVIFLHAWITIFDSFSYL